jgi:crotonobetainyl-CoA:carnitine CoA-transferase CaiB-like acyl-CoA transferase
MPEAPTPPLARGALDGVRVLDLTTVVMGPYATQLLGDLGADVIKVETGAGDGSRVMGGGSHPELSGTALNLHRNKRSIVVDLKKPEGREVLLRLLDTCDVFVTNLRPGPIARLGLSYEAVAPTRPRLVYCAAHGFRGDSDEGDLPAYDDIIQALSGLPRLNEAALGITFFLPSLIADKVAGMTISWAVLAALVHRERTGEGQRVEVPMFDAVLAFTLVEHLARAAIPGEPAGYSRILTNHRGPHKTKDGFVAMMPYTDAHWHSLFRAVGREELLDEPWFTDHGARLLHADKVYGSLAAIIAERTTAEWIALSAENGIPVSVVPTLDEVLDDPELHRGVITAAEHPAVGAYRQVEPPVAFSASPASVRRPAPLLGEHTAELLAEAGYTAHEVAALIEGKSVRVRPVDTSDEA